MRITLEERCSRSAIMRKKFIAAAMDDDGGGEVAVAGVMLAMKWGRAGLGGAAVGQGQPFWAARLDAVPGSIGVPTLFPHPRQEERSSAGNTCLGA